MSHFVLKNYWPSLVLSLVLLVGIGVCLRKLDCLAVEEVRALITIVFGSATSCLLLSFVWLIQRKPLHRPWPNQGLVLGRDHALPSMHPRGRVDSFDSFDGEAGQQISTISALELERPPSYDDALVHSKPLIWHRPTPASERKISSARQGHSKCVTEINCGPSSERKISYIQLDVGQLLLSSSPPKYYELRFDNLHDNIATSHHTMDLTQAFKGPDGR